MRLFVLWLICVTIDFSYAKVQQLKPNNRKRHFCLIQSNRQSLCRDCGYMDVIISPADKFLDLEKLKLPPLSSGASELLFPGVLLAVLPVRGRRGWYLAMEPNPTEGQCRSVGGPAGPGSPPWRRSCCLLSFPWPFLIPQALATLSSRRPPLRPQPYNTADGQCHGRPG